MSVKDTNSLADKVGGIKFPTEFPTNKKLFSTNDFKAKIEESVKAMQQMRDEKQEYALAVVQMPDPFNPEDKTGEDAMRDLMEVSAKTASIEAEAAISLAKINSDQNKPIEISTLVGKEIQYNNNVKTYTGFKPAEFEFNIDYGQVPEGIQASIVADIKIYDSNNKLAYSNNRHYASPGDNTYSWDGRDREGNQLDAGKYRLEVTSATATYFDGGQKFEISVEAKSTLSGVVREVRLNDEQVPISMVLEDGRVIEREQLFSFTSNVATDDSAALDSSLVGQEAEFDFSRLKIANGSSTLYFCNTEEASQLKVRIYDTITGERKKELNLNDIDVSDYKYDVSSMVRDLADGLYNVEVFAISQVEGQTEPQETLLGYSMQTAGIAGVNLVEKFVTTVEGMQVDAANIGFVGRNTEGNVLEKLSSAMEGKAIIYNNNQVRYDANQMVVGDFEIDKADDGKILLSTVMMVSDIDNNLVAMKRWENNPYNMLTDEAKDAVRESLPDIPEAVFSQLNGNEGEKASYKQSVEIIRQIDKLYSEEAIEYAREYKDSADKYQVYLEWGGEYNQTGAPEGLEAEDGQMFKIKYNNDFIDENGELFSSVAANTTSGIISDLKFDGSEISHYVLNNGQTIRADQMVQVMS